MVCYTNGRAFNMDLWDLSSVSAILNYTQCQIACVLAKLFTFNAFQRNQRLNENVRQYKWPDISHGCVKCVWDFSHGSSMSNHNISYQMWELVNCNLAETEVMSFMCFQTALFRKRLKQVYNILAFFPPTATAILHANLTFYPGSLIFFLSNCQKV